MTTDPFANALAAIDNAERVGHLTVELSPASNEVENVLEVFEERGYVDSYTRVDDGRGGTFEVELSGAINACGPVKPRYSAGADEFEKWEKRFLPARDYGTLVVTTSHGVMSHYEARDAGVGGQVIAYVY